MTTGWHTDINDEVCYLGVNIVQMFQFAHICLSGWPRIGRISRCGDEFISAESALSSGADGLRSRARSLVFSLDVKETRQNVKKWWVATLRGTYVDTDNLPTDEPVKRIKTRMKTFFKGPLATKDRKPWAWHTTLVLKADHKSNEKQFKYWEMLRLDSHLPVLTWVSRISKFFLDHHFVYFYLIFCGSLKMHFEKSLILSQFSRLVLCTQLQAVLTFHNKKVAKVLEIIKGCK
jgi:hypothetical protein